MLTDPTFFGISELLDRVLHIRKSGGRRISILVGSGLTTSVIPGVERMIGLARASLGVADEGGELLAGDETNDSSSRRYQRAIETVQARRGLDTVNNLVQTCVLHARLHEPTHISSAHALTSEECERLELDHQGWSLPMGVSALAELLVNFRDLGLGTILTTNFDPLLEIAVRRAGGHPVRTILDIDGRFDRTVTDGQPHIVHLHGYWHGSDTMHSPIQLGRPRPHLRDSLEKLLRDDVLIVVGYGGWSDVFTQTLIDLVKFSTFPIDVLWTFYEAMPHTIIGSHRCLLREIQGGRVMFYRDIDARRFFPGLMARLGGVGTPDRYLAWRLKTLEEHLGDLLGEEVFLELCRRLCFFEPIRRGKLMRTLLQFLDLSAL